MAEFCIGEIDIGYTGSSIYIRPLVKFLQFLSPFQMNFKTNDISYESPYKGRLESGKKLGVAPS